MRPPVHMLRGKFPFLDEKRVTEIEWGESVPRGPAYLFETNDDPIDLEYEGHLRPTDVFAESCVGFQSHRDHFVLSPSADVLRERIQRFVRSDLHDVAKEFALKNTRDWTIEGARRRLTAIDWEGSLTPCAWRPFVTRQAALTDALMDFPRDLLVGSMLGRRNLALCLPKAVPDNRFQHAQMADLPVHDCYSSTKSGEAVHVFPAWRYAGAQGDLLGGGGARVSNLKPGFVARLATLLGVPAAVERTGEARDAFDPIDVQSYCYAIYQSQAYRLRYFAQFKKGFARVPFPPSAEFFWTLAGHGRRLTALHLLRETAPSMAKFPEPGTNEIAKLKVEADGPAAKRIWINRTQYFANVQDLVWDHKVGAFQVLPKWLEWHREADAHFEPHEFLRLAGAIEATFPLVRQIDAAIDAVRSEFWKGNAA
ncbi:MAG: hypothetical protein NBV67_02485 [Tagaea sp.]|nr:hypothetical protein [Tagaea sp.]